VAVVSGGYGRPESGAIVAGGYGTSEPAPPGSVTARLTGTGTLTGTLTSTGGTVTGGGGLIQVAPVPWLPRTFPAPITARLRGTSRLTADLTAVDWSWLTVEINNVLLLVDA